MQLFLIVRKTPCILSRSFYSYNFSYLKSSKHISLSEFNYSNLSSVCHHYLWQPNLTTNYDLRKRVVPLFGISNHKRFFSTTDYNYHREPKPTPFEINERRFELDGVFEKKFLLPDEWSSIIEECSSSQRKIFSREVFDTFVIQKCLLLNNIDLANSYLDCQTLREVNFSALTFYLLLLGKNINAVRLEQFNSVYEILMENLPLPDTIIKLVIKALCLTENWRLVFPHIKYLETSKASRDIKNVSYNCISRALIKNKSLEEGLKYLVINRSIFNDKTVEEALINVSELSNVDKKKEHLILVIKYLQRLNKTLNTKSAELITSISENCFDIKRQCIGNGEQCHLCGGSLNQISLDEKKVSMLRDAFEESAVKGPDIFQTTTPEEWENFKSFLKTNGTFNVVVDWLNFLHGTAAGNDHRILKFFRYLMDHYKNILIISRLHTRNRLLRLQSSNRVFKNIKFFFLQNETKDDAYILYAALYSGLGCYMITRDYLRDYSILMRKHTHLFRHFSNWQKLHQLITPEEANSFNFLKPYQYHRITQYNESTKSWHIPVSRDEEFEYFEHDDEWICLRDLKKDGASVENDACNIISNGKVLEDGASVKNDACNVISNGKMLEDGASVKNDTGDVISNVKVIEDGDDNNTDDIMSNMKMMAKNVTEGDQLFINIENDNYNDDVAIDYVNRFENKSYNNNNNNNVEINNKKKDKRININLTEILHSLDRKSEK